MFACSTSVLAPLRSIARFSTTSRALQQFGGQQQFQQRARRPIGINRIELLGTLESEPQKVSDARNGREFFTLSMVTRIAFERRDGSFGVNEDYHNVIVGKAGLVNHLVNRKFKQGTNLFVIGRMSYEEGEDNTRTPVVNAEVIQELEPSARIAATNQGYENF